MTLGRRAVLLLVAGLWACARVDAQRSQVDALRLDMAQHDANLEEVERAAANLSSEWHEVTLGYERAKHSYAMARRRFDTADRTSADARDVFIAASEEWKRAEMLWDFYRDLVLLAATIDAAALKGTPVCSKVSTQSYRHDLAAKGENLAGRDVDHIVPRSLGGADHPSNYQVLSSHVNRSQGAWWGFDKCLSVGAIVCAAAVAVSVKCGSYSMLP